MRSSLRLESRAAIVEPAVLVLLAWTVCTSSGVAASCFPPNTPPSKSAAPLPTDAELESAAAVVGEVLLENQNIFNLNDPKEDTRLFRLANRAHIKTRAYVIREQLLFETGDRYSRRLVDESARILRTDRYLYDASIRPVGCHDGKVDVLVSTRDVWTLNPGISFGRRGGKNSSGIELEELNVLGTGSAISASRKSGIDRSSTQFAFDDTHLGGSWVELFASYSSNSDGSTRALTLERPFYALDTRGAAGFAGSSNSQVDSLYDRGNIIDQFREWHRFAEGYRGWSGGLKNGWTQRWRVGATYDEHEFDRAPAWTGATLLPENRKLLYPWAQFDLIQDDYRVVRNHDQIQRTEDFYLGTRLSARLGWATSAFGADRDALTFSSLAGRGFLVSPRTTLLFSTALGGRLESGQPRNAVLSASARYYFEESDRRLFFTTLEGSLGRHLDLDNQILLGGDSGLRGYPLRYQTGTARALLTVEQRYFSDWYPFRLFRVGGAIFFDVGRTWGTTPIGTQTLGLLKDVGLGLRLGNSRSGLGNIIHVDVAFPLDGDQSIKKLQFIVETKERF